MNRLERDRALFDTNARRRLVETISQASPKIVAGAIAKAVELQIVAEDFARSRGVECNPEEVGRYAREHSEEIAEQVDRALTAFICSIVSQEG